MPEGKKNGGASTRGWAESTLPGLPNIGRGQWVSVPPPPPASLTLSYELIKV